MKDWAFRQLAALLAPAAFRRWGIAEAIRGFRVVHFDSGARSLEVEFELKGDPRSLRLQVARYTVAAREGRHYLRLDRIQCDREWLSRLLQQFVGGREWEIPSWARPFLSHRETP